MKPPLAGERCHLLGRNLHFTRMSEHHDYTEFDLDLPNTDLCTVSGPADGHGRYVSHRSSKSSYGHVEVVVAPHPGVHCYRFSWQPAAASLPLAFMRAACFEGVKSAVVEPLGDGRRIAFVEVTVVDGSYHELDTNEQSMRIAAYLAVRDALKQAQLVDI